jgi:hypothetical protein
MHPYQKMIREKLKAAKKGNLFIAVNRRGKSILPIAIPIGGTVYGYYSLEKANEINEIFINEWSKEK